MAEAQVLPTQDDEGASSFPTPAAPNTSPVSISEPDQTPNTQISLAPNSSEPVQAPTQELAQKRSDKFDYALGHVVDQTSAQIYMQIYGGKEFALRDQAAAAIDANAAQQRQKMLIDAANNKGAPLDYTDIRRIMDPFNPANKPADPDSVMERGYGTKYINSIRDAAAVMKNTVLDDAEREIPEQIDPLLEKGGALISKMEYVRTWNENLGNQVHEQGWLPYLLDQAKSLTQIYPEVKLRGLNTDVGAVSGGLLLGSNMKAQADALLRIPDFDTFKQRVDGILGPLSKDNPSLARQFSDYLVGTSTAQKFLDNTFTLLAIPDIGVGLNLGKALVRKVSVYNRATQAFKDTVRSAATAGDTIPIRAAVAEGAGNVGEAGVIRAADSATKTLNGQTDFFRQIVEALPSNFRLDMEQLATNPGSLSREQLVRLQDSFSTAGNNILNVAMNAARVNRTPIPLEMEKALTAYRDVVKGQFPGLDNAILDFSAPVREPITNTWHTEVHLSNLDGNLFSSPEVAKNFADFHGLGGVKVMEEKGAVQTIPEQLVGSKTDIRTKTRLEKSLPETEALYRKFKATAADKTLSAEVRAEAKSYLTGENDIREIIKRDKATLAAANKRVSKAPAVVEQNGLGYKIVVVKPYDETSDVVRNYMIERNAQGDFTGAGASNVSNSKSTFLAWASKWRGADDTLALNESIQRKVATYTQNLFKQWARDESSKIESIATGYYKNDPVTGASYGYWSAKPRALLNKVSLKQRQVWNEFTQVLDYARRAKDELGRPGYFFKTPGELEDHYLRYFSRSPSFPEVEAYFAHVKLTEGNRIFSEIAEFRNRARIGTEQHQLSVVSGRDLITSGYFDGIHQKEFPGGRDNILIMGDRKGDETLHNLGSISLPPKKLAQLKSDVQQGLRKVIRIYNPDEYPLRKFSDVAGGERVRYVLSDRVDTKPLDFNHVTRRGGGHFDYAYEHYIKQAQIVPERAGAIGTDKRTKYNDLYVGDQTVMPIDNRAKGRDIALRLDNVRKLIAADKLDEAKALSEKTLPISWDEVSGWFKPKRDPEGNILPPRLSKTEPFYVVRKNSKIYDIDKSLESRYPGTFRDGTREGSDAAQNRVAFNLQRDSENLHTIEGGRDSSLWKYEPAKMVDPIPTMNRSLNRAINSTYMDDYKIYAVEHWLREAGPYLKENESSLRASPFWNFNNANDKNAFKLDTPIEIMNKLLANKQKINQFVGIPNTFDTWVHSLTQHLADTAYEKGGLAEKAAIIPLWMLSHVHDPVRLLRSFAFNAKLGVFALPQILVQMQTYASIIGVAGFQHGAGGTAGAFLHGWASINRTPGFLAKLDAHAATLGFGRVGDWLEANKLLRETGFEHVAGEFAMSDNIQHKFIGNDWGNFLNAGQGFFRQGERNVRLGAWYTAYREFREVNPTGAISANQRASILQRADLLTTNMSRASSSALHTGVMGLTTQFLTYQLRLAELMLGNRISGAAKLRMAAVYSGLYGVPIAFGLTGLPLGDVFRKEAVSRGYVMGNSWWQSLAMEGIPATLGALVKGKGELKADNFYNVGNRYGVQGFQQLWSDQTWWKMLGGAGTSIFANTIASSSPLALSFISYMRGDPTKMDHPFKYEDALDVFKEVSSVNTAWQILTAMNTGKWMSKNEQYQGNVSTLNALFQGATGLHSQRADDAFSITQIQKTEADYQKYTEKMVIKEIRRGLEDSSNKNQDQANEYMRRAFGRMEWANMPLDMRADVVSKALRGFEDQASQVEHNFATSHVPSNKQSVRTEQYRTRLQQDNKP